MVCINCGRAINGKICDCCGTDYRTDEEKKELECNHIYNSVMYEESIKDMNVNLMFKCQKCNQVTMIRTTRDFFRSMTERW
jgi:hypothetical protein